MTSLQPARRYAAIALDDDGGVRVSYTAIRAEAVRRITSQMLLADIVKRTRPADDVVQMAVIEELTNQDALAGIAENSANWWEIRKAAADKLRDKDLAQTIYDDIAKCQSISREQWIRNQKGR